MFSKQVLCPLRKPLIVMSPKSLLRHKETVSSLDELASGSFQVVLDDQDDVAANSITKLIICSGKVYYDLNAEKQKRDEKNVAIIRLEQLYPFPHDDLQRVLAQYASAKSITWCQEEPMNQGAWYSSQHNIRRAIVENFPNIELRYAGRDASAAAAAGYPALHLSQQEQFIDEALS